MKALIHKKSEIKKDNSLLKKSFSTKKTEQTPPFLAKEKTLPKKAKKQTTSMLTEAATSLAQEKDLTKETKKQVKAPAKEKNQALTLKKQTISLVNEEKKASMPTEVETPLVKEKQIFFLEKQITSPIEARLKATSLPEGKPFYNKKDQINKIYFLVKLKKKSQKRKPRFFRNRSKPFLEKKKKKRKVEISKAKYGILRIAAEKRNIFCSLSDSKGNIRASVTSGLLKVKGRKRQALHIVRATGQIIIKKIFHHKITNLILINKGRAYKKKKKTLLKTFSKVKKLKFLKINRPAPRSHNGCRPQKIRRK